MGRLEREKRTVVAMIRLHCRRIHRAGHAGCDSCRALERYALGRIERCRYGAAKPVCSRCPVHCYARRQREAIRAVMRYSGPRMLRRHPLLALGHLLDGLRPSPPRPG